LVQKAGSFGFLPQADPLSPFERIGNGAVLRCGRCFIGRSKYAL
jgi:hypothetical protein